MSVDLVMAEHAIATMQEKENLFEVAIRTHARMVYRIAHSVLRNSAEAEDVTQEVFLRTLRQKNISRIQDQKAWLARIAWRLAVERNRTARPTGLAGEADQIPSRERAADEILWQQERAAFLEQLIEALPDPLRHPLVLWTLEELSPREVAKVLDISEAAVRSRAFRARQILRERLTAWMERRR